MWGASSILQLGLGRQACRKSPLYSTETESADCAALQEVCAVPCYVVQVLLLCVLCPCHVPAVLSTCAFMCACACLSGRACLCAGRCVCVCGGGGRNAYVCMMYTCVR